MNILEACFVYAILIAMIGVIGLICAVIKGIAWCAKQIIKYIRRKHHHE